MQTVAIAWHLYLLTNSALSLGLLGLFRAVPFMALSLAGGALADAIDRKRLLLLTQSTQMVLTGVLVVAVATGHSSAWLLYAMTFLTGTMVAFDGPARQALIPNLVPRNELAGALTINTVLRQTATIVGPGIGGLIIARFGLAAAYLGNAVSFSAVVIALLMMSNLRTSRSGAANNWERVMGGVNFARREPLVWLPLWLDFATRIPVTVRGLLPIFARDVFAQGAEGLGLMNAAISAGAVVGGLVIGGSRPTRYPVAIMVAAYLVEGLFAAGFGFASIFSIALVMLFGSGVCDVIAEVLRSTVMQLKTPDNVRGRVSALASMFGGGGPQLAQIESGLAAQALGPVGAAVWGGVAAIAITVGFALHPKLRRGLGATYQALAEEATVLAGGET